jgi:heat shock protein HtpX
MDQGRFINHNLRNSLQTASLMAVLAILLGYLAWFLGGESFVWGALAGVFLLYLANPAGSPRLLLSMYRARPIRIAEAQKLYRIAHILAQQAGFSRLPELYYIPTPTINAFTTGHRDEVIIALSDGLLRHLDLRELTGVLSHELSHVANGDIQVMTFADLVSRITGLLSLFGQVLLISYLPLLLLGGDLPPVFPIFVLLAAPSLSLLAQLALSRNREFEADRVAADLSGDPEGLAMALAKLERQQGAFWEQLVMPGRRVPDPSILRTHPPTEERIRRLMERTPRSNRYRPELPWSRDASAGVPDWPGRSVRRHPRWHVTGLWY